MLSKILRHVAGRTELSQNMMRASDLNGEGNEIIDSLEGSSLWTADGDVKCQCPGSQSERPTVQIPIQFFPPLSANPNHRKRETS